MALTKFDLALSELIAKQQDSFQTNSRKRLKALLTNEQILALTLALHYKLIRDRRGWVSMKPEFPRKEKIIRPAIVRKLWNSGYLQGNPGPSRFGTREPYVVMASDEGTRVLKRVREENGIFYNVETHCLVSGLGRTEPRMLM